MKAIVKKSREYVWRSYCWGQHADFNYITCWHVYDEDSGSLLEGGHDSGHNQRSGSARFSRKRDALAWADGFMAALEGSVSTEHLSETEWAKFGLSLDDGSGRSEYGKRLDVESRREQFAEGVFHGLRKRSKAA